MATADAASGEPRYVLGRIDQDTWDFTFRVNLALSPELTLQYYGSPFIGTGRYTRVQAGDRHARAGLRRTASTCTGRTRSRHVGEGGRYFVDEAAGGRYSFANPDFSFRQFRSNLVARWEYKPGSSLYVVWSQGRTGLGAVVGPLVPVQLGRAVAARAPTTCSW